MSSTDMPAHLAAVDICNRFATMYVDVHCQAGPWGTKHLDDVTSIIQSAIDASNAEKDKEIERLKAENGRLKSEQALYSQTCEHVATLQSRNDELEAALALCIKHRDGDASKWTELNGKLTTLSALAGRIPHSCIGSASMTIPTHRRDCLACERDRLLWLWRGQPK